MIRIITDSAADIDLQEAQKLQITILPMQIQFGEQSFLDRYEITADAFYQKLIETDTLPSTSQINPYTFEEEFEKVNASSSFWSAQICPEPIRTHILPPQIMITFMS